MSPPELFHTPQEVASMFRLTATALNSQRKRGIAPGALAVKVGGKYLYPRGLIDYYLSQLAEEAQASLGLDDSVVEDLFRTTPTRRFLSLPEAAERLGVNASELSTQWENNTYPGALGWRTTPDAEIVFAARDLDIWTESHAQESRQDTHSTRPD